MKKSVLQPFDQYQKARIQFVQTVAELATRPQNVEALQNAGVMALLRPLLLDNVESIQQSAALALGRLATYSDNLAKEIVSYEILPQLVYSLNEQNRFFKKAAAFVLRAVAKHSPFLASAVVESGALDALVNCLEEFDPSVKENAAWALSYIAKHNKDLASHVVNAGAVPLLVLCLQEPEIKLKKISAAALSEICKHNADLAQKVVDQQAVKHLTSLIESDDAHLKRQVCNCLAQISKHKAQLAQAVVKRKIFPSIFNLLKDQDLIVRKYTATCIREIARQGPDMAGLICKEGGGNAFVEYIDDSTGAARLPGIMCLGFIGALDGKNATALIAAKCIPPLKRALKEEAEDHIQAAAAWTLGMIGRHSASHAKAMAENDVPSDLLAVYMMEESSVDLKEKTKNALIQILDKCNYLQALQPLIKLAPDDILFYVLKQFAKTLKNDPAAKKDFVVKGGLKAIQAKYASADEGLKKLIKEINSKYPSDIVQYYSPDYNETLMKKLDEQTKVN